MSSKKQADRDLAAKIRSLPPEKVAEVEDFVEFLRERSAGDAPHLASSMRMSERAFDEVWNNPDDAAYDAL